MTLDIIIPQYRETELEIKDLLNSIEFQIDKEKYDFQVIIINDGSKVWLSNEFLNQYSFKLKYIKRPHMGVSNTRQYGVDISSADFIMFCDADDIFCSKTALYLIFLALDFSKDVITAPLYIGAPGNSIATFDLRTPTKELALNGVIHGRIYNRLFLKKFNITWEPSLDLNEDLYFNICVGLYNPTIYYIDQGFYYWRCNEKSVTQSNDYGGKNFSKNFIFFNLVVDKLLSYNKKEDANVYLLLICRAVYTIIKYNTAGEKTEEVLETFKKFINKYKNIYQNLDKKYRLEKLKLKLTNFIDEENYTDEQILQIDKWILEQIEAD